MVLYKSRSAEGNSAKPFLAEQLKEESFTAKLAKNAKKFESLNSFFAFSALTRRTLRLKCSRFGYTGNQTRSSDSFFAFFAPP
jgi:hypothetical protein